MMQAIMLKTGKVEYTQKEIDVFSLSKVVVKKNGYRFNVIDNHELFHYLRNICKVKIICVVIV